MTLLLVRDTTKLQGQTTVFPHLEMCLDFCLSYYWEAATDFPSLCDWSGEELGVRRNHRTLEFSDDVGSLELRSLAWHLRFPYLGPIPGTALLSLISSGSLLP
jgi:hypothetical protein